MQSWRDTRHVSDAKQTQPGMPRPSWCVVAALVLAAWCMAGASAAAEMSPEEVQALTTKRLRGMLADRGVECIACTEKVQNYCRYRFACSP